MKGEGGGWEGEEGGRERKERRDGSVSKVGMAGSTSYSVCRQGSSFMHLFTVNVVIHSVMWGCSTMVCGDLAKGVK